MLVKSITNKKYGLLETIEDLEKGLYFTHLESECRASSNPGAEKFCNPK